MRRLDFIIQTILFATTFVSAVCSLLIQEWIIFFAAVAMFLIGVWQLLSALATTIKAANASRFRKMSVRLYWILVAVYFVVLAALFFLRLEEFATIWFFTAWGIAIYYYVFTIRLVFLKYDEKKSFMDIGN